MSHPLRSLIDIYAFNSISLRLGLADLSNEHSLLRSRDGKGNSISFLTGHLLASRVGLLRRFGETEVNPYSELFGGGVAIQDGAGYPDVGELARGWDDVATRLESTLAALTEDQLLAPAEGLPVPDQTARGAVMFMAWHESYHLGQIGTLRVDLGYPSVQARLYESMAAAS